MAGGVLWKILTQTDFRAMHGEAQESGSGGGARHVALGVDSAAFPIRDFLSATGDDVAISTQLDGGELLFRGNPARRGGEWIIRDQHSNRHPAWHEAAGFPTEYDEADPPIILVLCVGGKYFARFVQEAQLADLNDDLRQTLLAKAAGIADFDILWAPELEVQVPNESLYDELRAAADAKPEDPFDPQDVNDGRTRVLTELVRRQGQRGFRKKLLDAYEGECAITGCKVEATLEAAHITPYLGPETNHVSNGLLLRADIHTLFDLGLLAVYPDSLEVGVAKALTGSEYETLEGTPLKIPSDEAARPSAKALQEHKTRSSV